jgi:hypothetical protein
MPFVEAKNEKITQNFIVFEENETIGISLAAIALDLRKILHLCNNPHSLQNICLSSVRRGSCCLAG